MVHLCKFEENKRYPTSTYKTMILKSVDVSGAKKESINPSRSSSYDSVSKKKTAKNLKVKPHTSRLISVEDVRNSTSHIIYIKMSTSLYIRLRTPRCWRLL